MAHGGATLQLHTGSNTFTRPSMGSWVIYGSAPRIRICPPYITLKPGLSHGGAKKWSSGFLPAAYQGTAVGLGGMPLENITGADRASEKSRPHVGTAALRVGHDPEDESRQHGALADMNRIWKLGFNPLSWRSECKPRRRKRSTSPRNPKQRRSSTDSTQPETKDFGWQCLMARTSGRAQCPLHPDQPRVRSWQ